MTLELSQVASQIREMRHNLDKQTTARNQAAEQAHLLLQKFSTEGEALIERVERAEKIQRDQQRFDWIGAVPTTEPLARSYPLPSPLERATIIASDGSQILPDRHAITLYYLINIGSIVYRHGSNCKPETYNPKPLICYELEDILDEQGNIISAGEIRVKRDLAELEVLSHLSSAYTRSSSEPVVALIDGQLTLRVIDLPFYRQEEFQKKYIDLLNQVRKTKALIAGYIDRPHSSFTMALIHLASLELEAITEETLRQNPFRHLTDVDLFNFLGPGERSALFAIRAKGMEPYNQAGHTIHFFYLNVSHNRSEPQLARIEVPGWIASNPQALDILHTSIVRQARLTGGYPYVLARAHELAIISTEEREAVEMMLALEMRRQGLSPTLSPKQLNKTLLTGREGFRL